MSSVAVGGSGCAVTWIVKVCDVLVSLPPLAVPPLSTACTVTVAVPEAFGAGVKVSDPSAATAGCPPTVKSRLLEFMTANVTLWPDSSAGPGLIAVAQPGVDLRPCVLEHDRVRAQR